MTSISDYQHPATTAHPLPCNLWPTEDLVSMQREIHDQLSNFDITYEILLHGKFRQN